jgi:hypothetical protein
VHAGDGELIGGVAAASEAGNRTEEKAEDDESAA